MRVNVLSEGTSVHAKLFTRVSRNYTETVMFSVAQGCLVLLIPFVNAGLTCLRCYDAVSIQDCGAAVTCGDDEKCYLEKIIDDRMNIILNAGCRSKTVCDLMLQLSSATGKRDLVECAQCCNTSNSTRLCNGYLCGQNPINTVRCRQCPQPVASAEDCKHITTCGATEVCYSEINVVGGNIRYMLGCREKHLCRNPTTVQNTGRDLARRLDTPLCSECCDGNECNVADCYQLQKIH